MWSETFGLCAVGLPQFKASGLVLTFGQFHPTVFPLRPIDPITMATVIAFLAKFTFVITPI